MSFKIHQDTVAWQWLGFAVIAFFVAIAYAPSLMHVPRGDQLMYFGDVSHKRTLWDLTIGSLDLNRHRTFNPGDEILFRPVMYFLLGAEKYFFGYDFMLWQALGIGLHLWVVWLLLRLLLCLHRGWPAILVGAFFALLFVNMEMVIWHHINGYLIFIASLLAVLWRFYNILDRKFSGPKHYIIMGLWLLLGAFTHELGVVVPIILAMVLWLARPQERRWAVLLLVVPIIYAAASVLNAYLNPFTNTHIGIYSPRSLSKTIKDCFDALHFWFYAGIFPFELNWAIAARTMIAPEEHVLIKPLHVFFLPTTFGIGVIVTYLLCLYRNERGALITPRTILAAVCFLIAAAFAVIISVGRGEQWGMWNVVRINSYYEYIFWTCCVVGLFACIDWKVSSLAKWMFAFCLSGLMIFNALRLYELNDKAAVYNNDVTVLINTIRLLIKEHGTEPDFSIYVDPGYPGNNLSREALRRDDPKDKQYGYTEVLFWQYFDRTHPKYRFIAVPPQGNGQ